MQYTKIEHIDSSLPVSSAFNLARAAAGAWSDHFVANLSQ
jgi:hypothetical protein